MPKYIKNELKVVARKDGRLISKETGQLTVGQVTVVRNITMT
jgi:hypothetical protein